MEIAEGNLCVNIELLPGKWSISAVVKIERKKKATGGNEQGMTLNTEFSTSIHNKVKCPFICFFQGSTLTLETQEVEYEDFGEWNVLWER